MLNYLKNEKQTNLRIYIATMSLLCCLNASSDWVVSTINAPTIPSGIGGGSVSGPGSIGFSSLKGITSSIVGDLYIADSSHNVIFRGLYDSSNQSFSFDVFAGVADTFGGDNGSKLTATFKEPHGVTISNGDLFIADSANNKIRKLEFSSGNVSDFVGDTLNNYGNDDGTGSDAKFHLPVDITAKDSIGTLYVADSMNNSIRQIDSSETVTTVTIPGGPSFDAPQAATYGDGYLYVADSGNNSIYKIDAATPANYEIFAGGTSGSHDGNKTNAQFKYITGILYDPTSKNLYVVDEGNNAIRQIDSAGNVTTIAGASNSAGTIDGTGDVARFAQLSSITMGADKALYVTQSGAIRKLVNTGNTPSGSNIGNLAGAASDVINKSAQAGDNVEDQEFRFGLSTEQIMMTMRQRGINFAEINSRDPYARALNAIEKTIDSTHAIRQIGKGMTIWASGLYTQGNLDAMFGNPAAKTKHYAIMVGGHYKDAATQQIFGVAVNVGFGNSITNTDKDLKTDNKATQITLYYNKKFDEEGHWKFSWHNTLMRSMDRHQRPFVDSTTGNRLIAIGNGVTYEFASSMEFSYKHEFSKDNFIKPFTALNYAYNKELAYKEENVGTFNRSYNAASTDQVGLQFGLKSSIGYKVSDTKTFVVMPKVSYTLFAKMGHTKQLSANISSGQTSIGQSGTPGKHLLSATLAIGIVDYEANTTTRFAYTGNVQKQKRSHEIMLDWGMKF